MITKKQIAALRKRANDEGSGTVCLGGDELADVLDRIDRLEAGLRAIDEHHTTLNATVGRPASRSKTLRLAREALRYDAE
jgi:GTP cyclohydrolase III